MKRSLNGSSMRVVTQILVLGLVAGAGAGWHFYADRLGVPRPLALVGLEAQAPQAGGGGAPRGGPPAVGVVAAPVRAGLVEDRAQAVGTVRARDAVTVTGKVAGIVRAIHFQEGERVEAGQVLVELDDAALRAELDQARAQLDDARSQLERARRLQPGQTIAEQRITTLETQARQAEGRVRQVEARIEEMRITAPFSGRVGLRQVSPGALIQPGTAITTLDDTSRVRVEFSIPEVFLARVRPGARVTARSSAYGERVFHGVVAVVDTRVDTATRTIRVIGEFDNPDDALRPGLFVTVELLLDRRPNALLVPEEALDPVGDRMYLYVVREGRARRQQVRIGQRLVGEVEVLDGVREGELVVVRGVQRLRDNLPVRVTETMTRPTS
jgi:membrane fusion protein (multidrug efflux system)